MSRVHNSDAILSYAGSKFWREKYGCTSDGFHHSLPDFKGDWQRPREHPWSTATALEVDSSSRRPRARILGGRDRQRERYLLALGYFRESSRSRLNEWLELWAHSNADVGEVLRRGKGHRYSLALALANDLGHRPRRPYNRRSPVAVVTIAILSLIGWST